MPKPNETAILVLGTADWNQPIATNQHYVVRELCESDCRVTFVESLALRRPTFSRRDVHRALGRLRMSLHRPSTSSGSRERWRARPSGLVVLSPIVIPLHHGPTAAINRVLLSRTVAEWKAHRGPRILWCYTPTTYGLDRLAHATIYHCVDLLGDVPGISKSVISRNERRLAAEGATALASSEVVQDHLFAQGFADVRLWENVADTEVFVAAASAGRERQPGRVIFAGNLAPSKVDYTLLQQLAKEGLDVRVAGPRAEGGGRDQEQFDSLTAAGVTYLGMLSIEQLADELATCTVGLIPYVINPYTRGVSPLKTYEYLSAGLPVVATALPGVSPDGVDVFTEHSAQAFVARVKGLAAGVGPDDNARRVGLADEHSWRSRGEQARLLVAERIGSGANAEAKVR